MMSKEDKKVENLMLGTVALSSVLITYFDELEQLGYTKQKLKQVLKVSKKETEKYVDLVFNQVKEEINTTLPSSLYIEELSKAIQKLVEI